MEKLLEQEALLEQQDPKVRVPRPALEAPGSEQEGRAADQACPGPWPLPPRARQLGNWTFAHSLLCLAKTGMRLRACLRSVPKVTEISDAKLGWGTVRRGHAG